MNNVTSPRQSHHTGQDRTGLTQALVLPSPNQNQPGKHRPFRGSRCATVYLPQANQCSVQRFSNAPSRRRALAYGCWHRRSCPSRDVPARAMRPPLTACLRLPKVLPVSALTDRLCGLHTVDGFQQQQQQWFSGPLRSTRNRVLLLLGCLPMLTSCIVPQDRRAKEYKFSSMFWTTWKVTRETQPLCKSRIMAFDRVCPCHRWAHCRLLIQCCCAS